MRRPPDKLRSPGWEKMSTNGHYSNSKTQASSRQHSKTQASSRQHENVTLRKNNYPSQMSRPLLLHYYSTQSDGKSMLVRRVHLQYMYPHIYENKSIELDTEINGKTNFPIFIFIQQFFLAATQHFHPTWTYARLFPHLINNNTLLFRKFLSRFKSRLWTSINFNSTGTWPPSAYQYLNQLYNQIKPNLTIK